MRWADPGSQFVRFVGSAEREGKAGGDQESPRARESWIIGLGVPTVAAASLRNGTADLQRKNLVRPRAARTGTVGGSAAPMPSLSPSPQKGASLASHPLSCVPGKVTRTSLVPPPSPPLTEEYGEPDQEGRHGEDEPPVADGLVVWGDKKKRSAQTG